MITNTTKPVRNITLQTKKIYRKSLNSVYVQVYQKAWNSCFKNRWSALESSHGIGPLAG